MRIVISECQFNSNDPEKIKEDIKKSISHLGIFEIDYMTDDEEEDWEWERSTYNDEEL